MEEQLGGLYIATLILALVGLAVFFNALVSHGVRWTGRRVLAAWRSRVHPGGDRTPPAGSGEPEPSAFALDALATPPDGGAHPDEQRAFPDRPSSRLVAR